MRVKRPQRSIGVSEMGGWASVIGPVSMGKKTVFKRRSRAKKK